MPFGPAANVARADDATVCGARQGASAVAACTHLIEGGRASGTALYLHYNNRGGAYQSIGTPSDHYRAIEDFSKAINLESKLPYAYINRGVSWAKLGAYDRAIGDFALALRVDPKNALAYNNRGGAHRDRGEFDLAMADFNRAIALDANHADARFNRATVYMQKEVYDRAIADFTAVIRQNSRDILALAARGHAWSGKGDLDRAKVDFEAVLSAPSQDEQSTALKDAVRELLRALNEKRAAIEMEAAHKKQAAAERAAQEKQALAAKRADEKAAAQSKAEQRKKSALEKKEAAQEKLAALQKSAPPAVPPPVVETPRKLDRLALVIGNAAYLPSLGPLDNPGNDAKDVAAALKALGFTVWLRLDLGHVEMQDALASFARAAHDVETVVVYYAGHGFQYAGTNYLAAVDSPITDDASIANHTSLNSVIAGLRAERGFRILIIDACRNNLIVERAAGSQGSNTQALRIARGLAPVDTESRESPDTPAGGGMLIAFATLPGQVASEGAGRNSPFTHALVKHLPTPNLELRHLFVRVRADVIAATGTRQNPQVSDTLIGEYVFSAAAKRGVPARPH